MKIKKKLRSQSVQVILDAAIEKGLNTEIISKRFNLLKITHNGKSYFIKGTSFPVNLQPACLITNNKFLTKKILRANGIDVPKSWLVKSSKEARDMVVSKNLFPCVLKPIRGAHGHRVYANLESLQEFDEALPHVFNKPGEENVLIEEYIKGKNYRLLVVGNKVSAVMERIPAHVIGDGFKNIRQLIKRFNSNPLVGEKYEKPMCKIILNGEIKRNLKKQNLKLTYIPKEKEKIILRQNSNISTGGIGKDATDKIPEEMKRVAIKSTKAIGIVICGVDIIHQEKTGKFYVLELNDCPGIDIHHFPAIGKPQNVAKDIIEFLIKNGK
jgi:glutamate--cysteine ligase